MDKKKTMTIVKWIAIAILLSINFFFYKLNDEKLNLIMTVLIMAYSLFEFFSTLTKKKLNLGIKIYLFTFYSFATIALFAGISSFLVGNYDIMTICLLIIGGDTALILYFIHKFSRPLL